MIQLSTAGSVFDQIRAQLSADGTTIALVALGLLLCLVGLAVGIREYRNAYAIWSNDPVSTDEVGLVDGVVEVKGTAAALDSTIQSPYTDTESLVCSYKRERRETHYDNDDDDGPDHSWKTVSSGHDSVPFLVRDDAGEVAVAPDGADLEIGTDHRARRGDIRETERRLDPGDDVHVYGQKHTVAERRDDALAGQRHYVGDGEAVPTFQLTEGGELTAVGRTALKATLLTVLSSVAGLYVFDLLLDLLGFGPVVFG